MWTTHPNRVIDVLPDLYCLVAVLESRPASIHKPVCGRPVGVSPRVGGWEGGRMSVEDKDVRHLQHQTSLHPHPLPVSHGTTPRP